MTTPASDPSEGIRVPFSRVSTFVRQVTHDVRNNLNAVDLQSAYVLELITDPEAADEVKRIRSLIQQTAKQLQALSANFWTAKPSFVPYPAKIFFEDLQDRITKAFPEFASQVEWSQQLGGEEINIDIEMIFGVFSEIFRNATQFREGNQSIAVHAAVEGGRFVVEVRESGKTTTASPPEQWGVEPFISSRRGGYGLGLFRARGVLLAHDGEMKISHDSGRALLLTRVSLPLAEPA